MIPPTLIRLKKSITIPGRLENVISWYLYSLAMESQKHTLTHTAKLSGLDTSQFSRLLKEHPELAVDILKSLGQKRSKKIRRLAKKIGAGLQTTPWSIAIIIDSTLHRRSQLHGQNVQRHNHGGGFVIGHQWTNICLYMTGHLIPLPPIEFLSKKHCRKQGIPYQTEPDKIIDFLKNLDLVPFIGKHAPSEVVVLMDSGYDNKAIQRTILNREWDFVMALKSIRKAWINHQDVRIFGDKKQWAFISKLFNRFKSRAPRMTVRLSGSHGSKKSRVFDVKRLEGSIYGVPKALTLLASKKRGTPQWRYFACSRIGLPTSLILATYQIRFQIEQFHKDTKQYFGMTDAGLKHYHAVKAHVHWVYCSYLLIHDFHLPLVRIGTRERQKILMNLHSADELRHLIQLSSRINGAQSVQNYCRQKQELLYTM
jgi:hypothetical protein